jgi:hypothetical protein
MDVRVAEGWGRRAPKRLRQVAIWSGGLAALLLMAAAPVRAQSCHSASLRPTADEGLTYRVSVAGVLGAFTTPAGTGEYQGWFANASLAHEWFSADVALPFYRIAQTGSHAYGLGDLSLTARANLYRSPDRAFVAGPELGATLPTGDDKKELGMGHVMLMPGAFLAWHRGAVSLLTQLAYGRALMGSGHVHMDPMPLVNPMNRSELTHAIGVSVAVQPALRVTGRLLGAVPFFDHAGSAREVLAPGLQVIMGAFDASLELQLPVVGKPFTSRTVATLGAQW